MQEINVSQNTLLAALITNYQSNYLRVVGNLLHMGYIRNDNGKTAIGPLGKDYFEYDDNQTVYVRPEMVGALKMLILTMEF